MPDPIQGFDCSVMVIGSNGPELAGEFQSIDINVKNDTESYLELNEQIARHLDGEITIDGKLSRGWVSMDIVKRVFGSSTLRRGTKAPASPRFVILCTIDNDDKGYNGRYKLEQVIIPELAISIASGKGVVKKDLTWKAEGITEA